MSLTQALRLNGFIVETDLMKKSLKSQFKSVDRYNSKFLTVLNDESIVTFLSLLQVLVQQSTPIDDEKAF